MICLQKGWLPDQSFSGAYDTYLHGWYPTTPCGGEGCVPNDPFFLRLRQDNAALPSSSLTFRRTFPGLSTVVVGAELSMLVSYVSNAFDLNGDLYRVNRSWDGLTATWSSRGALPAVVRSRPTRRDYRFYHLASGRKDLLGTMGCHQLGTGLGHGSCANHGVVMISRGDLSREISFNSSEHGDLWNRPKLCVEYYLLPATPRLRQRHGYGYSYHNTNPNCEPNQHSNRYPDRYGDCYADAYGDSNTNSHADEHRDTHADQHSNAGGYANADLDTYIHPNADANAYTNGNDFCYSNADGCRDADANADGYKYSNGHDYANADGDAHPDQHCNANTHADATRTASPTPTETRYPTTLRLRAASSTGLLPSRTPGWLMPLCCSTKRRRTLARIPSEAQLRRAGESAAAF